MALTITAFLASKEMDFDAAILKFYEFMEKSKKISPLFTNMYFGASTREEAMRNPVPEEKDALLKKIREQTSTGELPAVGIRSYFHIFHTVGQRPSGYYQYVSVEFSHITWGNCVLTITFAQFDADEIVKCRDKLDKIYAAIIESFPVLYILEDCILKGINEWADANIRIGWSICANTEDMGRIKDFPSYEIAPGFTRVLSVKDLFDPSNPFHIERAKALDKEVASNRNFVKKTDFWVESQDN